MVELQKFVIANEVRQSMHPRQALDCRVAGAPRHDECFGSWFHAALDLHQTRSVAFFDAVILVAAQTTGCAVVLSEDMNAGDMVGGVRIVNPFAQGISPP